MFVLADSRRIDLTHGWGPTQRDLIAAAKAKKAVPGTTGSLAQPKANAKGATTDVVKVSTAAASNSQKRRLRRRRSASECSPLPLYLQSQSLGGVSKSAF